MWLFYIAMLNTDAMVGFSNSDHTALNDGL